MAHPIGILCGLSLTGMCGYGLYAQCIEYMRRNDPCVLPRVLKDGTVEIRNYSDTLVHIQRFQIPGHSWSDIDIPPTSSYQIHPDYTPGKLSQDDRYQELADHVLLVYTGSFNRPIATTKLYMSMLV